MTEQQQQQQDPPSFPAWLRYLSQMLGEMPSLGWGGWWRKDGLLRSVLGIQGWMSGTDQMPMRRGKKSTHQQRPCPRRGDQTGCPLHVQFSSVTNQHVTVKRGVKNGTKGLAKLRLSPWPTTRFRRPRPWSINTLSLTWPAQSKMKENNSLEVALGRAVGCEPWLITG